MGISRGKFSPDFAIAKEAGSGTSVGDIGVVLEAGSLLVFATIRPPAGTPLLLVHSSLPQSSTITSAFVAECKPFFRVQLPIGR
jgi:hypothetical protein